MHVLEAKAFNSVPDDVLTGHLFQLPVNFVINLDPDYCRLVYGSVYRLWMLTCCFCEAWKSCPLLARIRPYHYSIESERDDWLHGKSDPDHHQIC